MTEEIDRLYALPLDEFTAARDALARSLRTDGSRERADEVKRLRKPALVAWALNRVRHGHPERVSALLAAGERLREAQRQLVGGGERDLLRSAVAEERGLVEEVVGLAERELTDAGHPLSPTVQSKLFSTAHAAAAGTDAAELLRAGRLVHDYEVSDLGLPAAAAVASPAPKRPPVDPERRRAEAEAARQRKALTAQLERARSRASDLERRADEAQARAADAAQRVAELEAALQGLEGPA